MSTRKWGNEVLFAGIVILLRLAYAVAPTLVANPGKAHKASKKILCQVCKLLSLVSTTRHYYLAARPAR
jgi:hypothetical protein